jgi:ribonucleoside-diphosphate reductase alpha chain
MDQNILVTKRNGTTESLDLNKIHYVCEYACDGLAGVSSSSIQLKSQIQFFDGMKTSDIQETLIKAAAELISDDTPNYQYVASRLVNYDLRKRVYGGPEPESLCFIINFNINNGMYDSEITNWYTDDEIDQLDTYIDHDRDYDIVYAGMEQFRGKYLIKNRITNVFYETPQIAYMLIAMTLFRRYAKDERLKWVREYYDSISTFQISLPTPVMAGLRSPQRQFSSCVVIETDDTLDSINATSSAIIRYVSQKAGIGIGGGRIRAIGSVIRKGDATHTGVIPFYKYFQSAVKSCCVSPDSWIEILDK